jgi:hypothetical protein
VHFPINRDTTARFTLTFSCAPRRVTSVTPSWFTRWTRMWVFFPASGGVGPPDHFPLVG